MCILLRAVKYLPGGGATAFPPVLVLNTLSVSGPAVLPGGDCSPIPAGWQSGSSRVSGGSDGKDAVYIENDRKPNIVLCTVNHGSLCGKQYVSGFRNKRNS